MFAVRAVYGIPFGELFSASSLSDDGRDKALGHRAVIRQFGLSGGGSLPAIRTLPLDAAGRVREPTKMCRLDFQELLGAPFALSEVRSLLEDVLFIPIRKPDTRVPDGWSFGTPHRWIPDDPEWRQLEMDYEDIRTIVARGDADELSSSARSGYGEILMPKTSGRNAEDTQSFVVSGRSVRARRRAFFLRQSHTSAIVRESHDGDARGRRPYPGLPRRTATVEEALEVLTTVLDQGGRLP
jgi:hypothetical protein